MSEAFLDSLTGSLEQYPAFPAVIGNISDEIKRVAEDVAFLRRITISISSSQMRNYYEEVTIRKQMTTRSMMVELEIRIPDSYRESPEYKALRAEVNRVIRLHV